MQVAHISLSIYTLYKQMYTIDYRDILCSNDNNFGWLQVVKTLKADVMAISLESVFCSVVQQTPIHNQPVVVV